MFVYLGLLRSFSGWQDLILKVGFLHLGIRRRFLELLVSCSHIPEIVFLLNNVLGILEGTRTVDHFRLSNLTIERSMPLIISDLIDELSSQVMSRWSREVNDLVIELYEVVNLLLDSAITEVDKVPLVEIVTVGDIVHLIHVSLSLQVRIVIRREMNITIANPST